MKKYTFVFILALSFQIIGFSQSFNYEQKQNNTSMLLGKINKEALSQEPHSNWFTKNYNLYTPDTETISSLKDQLSPYTITAFMGTWCGDSKREIPKLYKILDEAQFSLDRLTLIAVDRSAKNYKQSPGGEHEGQNIHRVPTIIIYKNGKEVNRIVESPVTNLEQDLLQSIQGDYSPNHHIVSLTNQLLEEEGTEKFLKKSKKNIKELQKHAHKTSQLNTYANVLFYAGHTQKALAVLTFNTILFPKDAKTYMSLGNKQSKVNQLQEALESYQKALELEPANKKITTAITTIEENIKNTHSVEE